MLLCTLKLCFCSLQGKFIPNIARRIKESDRNHNATVDINLAGIAIGNGFITPTIQYTAYADFALANNLITKKASIGKTQ